MWVLSPVGNDTTIAGVMAVQIPIQQINDVMTGGERWKEQGLGDTGEVYLVGPDHLMRSVSRVLVEDPEDYAKRVIANGTPPDIANRVVEVGGTVLLQPINTFSVEQALKGESGTSVSTGYFGGENITAYSPVEIDGLNWVAVARIDTWGLSDPKDVPSTVTDTGYDLRAAGVQSFDTGDGDQLLAFAVDTHKRWSNAAANEYDVSIDTTGDGVADWIVFSADSGSVRTGVPDGVSEVFYVEVATDALFAGGFLATATTDSSTIILPVYASDLGLTSDAGTFTYTVERHSITEAGSDEMTGDGSTYDPWGPALQNGQFVEVPRNRTTNVDVAVNGAAFAAQKPLGVMSVVLDNTSGSGEAILIKAK